MYQLVIARDKEAYINSYVSASTAQKKDGLLSKEAVIFQLIITGYVMSKPILHLIHPSISSESGMMVQNILHEYVSQLTHWNPNLL